jgi:murein DD-endopeptidase MepM/ murein hydrolase activator NlpD
MRYKEFATSESIDRFMGTLMGTPSNTISDVIDKISGTTDSLDKTDKTDKTQPNLPGTSDGEILPVNGAISSPFGRRSSGMHLGTDFAVPVGTPVRAPQDGVVTKTGSDNVNGIYVQINSNGTVHSLLHLSKSSVSSGEKVRQGQTVGLSGNTGRSTGPHLHWSKKVSGRPVDPMSNIG